MKSVVRTLLIINIVVFLLQIFIKGFTESFMLIGADIFTRPWILLTSMFMHSGVSHILFNMYVLLMFGSLIENKIGPKRFLLVYLTAGLVAGFVSSFFYTAALGASGALMGIMGIVIILLPYLRVLFFFIIPMPMWAAAIGIVLIDLFGVFYPSGTGNIAHLVGLGVGLLFGLYLKNQRKQHQKSFGSKTFLTAEDAEEYLKSGRI